MMVMLISNVLAFTVTEYKNNLVYSGKFLKTTWSIQVPITKVIDTKPTTLKEYSYKDIFDYKMAITSKYPFCIWEDNKFTTVPTTSISTTTTTTKKLVTTTTKFDNDVNFSDPFDEPGKII